MKKKREFPNTYVIIFVIMAICAIATWFVPGGDYVQQGDTLVYTEVESVPQTWQIFEALYSGFAKQAGIIVFILIIGGAFWIVNSSKSIDVGIISFLNGTKKLERYPLLKRVGVNNIVMSLIIILFSLFGGVFGMSEETLAFVVVLVPLAISMGYDSIVGVCLVYVAAHVGFAGAFLNPFTVGIAQNLADIPMFSGMGYRLLCWSLLTAILIAVVLIYAARIKKDPRRSIVYESDSYWREKIADNGEKVEFSRNKSSVAAFLLALAAILAFTVAYSGECSIKMGQTVYSAQWLLPVVAALFVVVSVMALRRSYHFFVLTLLGFTIVYLIIGVLAFGWYIGEISALFLAFGLLCGISVGLSPNGIVKEFLNGAKDIMSAALVVGFAAGIIIILEDGKIIDSILHSMESGLGESGQMASLSLMYGIQTLINLVIPSATAKAAITIPIMAPFSDLIDLSRQAMVMAFQFGDGFTNMITPTSGVLIAALGMAKIPYSKWVKWVWKFILLLIIIGFLLLIPTVYLNLSGF
ncbi:MAG: AbgT family transporter [Bacteroidales bacterium]|nr:AbgT family transporter [Bacteroidales bacterium]